MKNLLYIAAIAATAVGFTSCSSNEDLNDAVKDSGVPFKVTASAPTTRATDVTTDNFTNFKLYAFEGSATTPWIKGQFTKSTSWAPASGTGPYTWPTAATTSNFYGVSENTTSMSSAFVDDIANSQSFTYTVPTTIADQKNLLVASTTGKSTDTQVALAFKNALAAATLTLKLTPTISDYGQGTTFYRFVMKIKSISICNIKTVGKYNYSTSTWSDQSTNGTYTYTFDTPLLIDVYYNETPTYPINLDGNNGKLMFIPQPITPWDITANTIGTTKDILAAGPQSSESYIKMEAMSLVYVPTDITDDLDGIIADPTELAKYPNLTKQSDGYYNGLTKIATLTGQVVDYSFSRWSDSNTIVAATTEAYAGSPVVATNTLTDMTTNNYCQMFKKFKISNKVNDVAYNGFLPNNIHNISIELATFARITDASATFGKGMNVAAAKKR